MVTIESLMAQGVVVARSEHSVDYVKRQMKTLDIHAVPVADASGAPVGLVRSHDLIDVDDLETPVENVMCRDFLTLDRRDYVQKAAALMRRGRHRQVIVTDQGRIAGIVSAFDFLELLEGYRFEHKDDAPDLRTGYINISDIPEGP